MQGNAELMKCIDDATELLISGTNRIRFKKSISSEFEKLQTELDQQRTQGYVEYLQNKKIEKVKKDEDYVVTETKFIDKIDGPQLEILSSVIGKNDDVTPMSKVIFQSDRDGKIIYKAMQMCKSEKTDDYEEVLKKTGVYHQFKHNQQNNLVINKLYWDVKEVASFFSNNINVLEFTKPQTIAPNVNSEITIKDFCNEIIDDATTTKKEGKPGPLFWIHEIAIAIGMMMSFYRINWGNLSNVTISAGLTALTMLSFIFVHNSYMQFKEDDTKAETKKKIIPYVISVMICIGLCLGSVFFFAIKNR